MASKTRTCIYLDHHATTPMDERVQKKIEPFFAVHFGNPASKSHPLGWDAQAAVDEARINVAQAINAHPTEIIFTSGATEASNLALKGLFWPQHQALGRHIVSSSIEHQATLSTLKALTAADIRVSLVRPQVSGLVDSASVLEAISPDTALVSLFMVHNEIGSINDIASISALVKERGVLFHCDAAQALGRVAIDCQKLSVDMMSFSGHKIYGPKGVGFLYVRRELMERLNPLIHGGGQEWQKRSGTLNVPAIVGLGEAARLATLDLAGESHRIKALRDRLLAKLSVLEAVHVNGTLIERVSGNLNVSFAGIDGEELVLAICNRVAISTGSACSASVGGPNRVLEELGVSGDLRQASIRFGLGRKSSEEEVDIAAELIVSQVKEQRARGRKKLIKIS